MRKHSLILDIKKVKGKLSHVACNIIILPCYDMKNYYKNIYSTYEFLISRVKWVFLCLDALTSRAFTHFAPFYLFSVNKLKYYHLLRKTHVRVGFY